MQAFILSPYSWKAYRIRRNLPGLCNIGKIFHRSTVWDGQPSFWDYLVDLSKTLLLSRQETKYKAIAFWVAECIIWERLLAVPFYGQRYCVENHYIEFYRSFQEYTKFDTDDDNYKMLNFSPPLHKVNALQKKN